MPMVGCNLSVILSFDRLPNHGHFQSPGYQNLVILVSFLSIWFQGVCHQLWYGFSRGGKHMANFMIRN